MSQPDFTKMTTQQFEEWKAANAPSFSNVAATSEALHLSTPSRPSAPQAADDVWAKDAEAKAAGDFVCPSGQRCKLRSLQPELLLERGILDRVTRLEGLANEVVLRAEGQPPTASKMPSAEDFKLVRETMNMVTVLAVEQPRIYEVPEDDEERVVGRIYVDTIALDDRLAIMDEALKGVRLLDRFRNAG